MSNQSAFEFLAMACAIAYVAAPFIMAAVMARPLVLRLAKALSLRNVSDYRAHKAMMQAYISHRPHHGDYWTRVDGITIYGQTRAAVVETLAQFGYLAA